MSVSGGFEGFSGELVLQTFDFLKAENVGCLAPQKIKDPIDAQANRVDVPARKREAFGGQGGVKSGTEVGRGRGVRTIG